MAETSNPGYAIEIGPKGAGKAIGTGLRQLIQKIEYESTDGMADMAKITLINPANALTELKAFQPGNELAIWFGYGSKANLKYVGRVIIAKHRPEFPEDGMPKLVVIGYTKDHKMMDNAPEKSKAGSKHQGRTHKDKKYSDVVKDIGEISYKMTADVDPTPEAPQNFVHKVGLTDYDFVQGLSNITGFVFWVDADQSGQWILHFKNPETLKEQDRELQFFYNQGDLSTLLSFKPELLIRDLQTKVKVQAKNAKSGKLIEFEVEEDNDQSPDVEAAGDLTGKIGGNYTTASDIKLFIGDFSFDIIGNRKFKNDEDAKLWARQWFRRHREQFILASGKVIGMEELMARQTHKLLGLGQGYDGRYYFTKVKHIFSQEEGYVCEFSVRKVVPLAAG